MCTKNRCNAHEMHTECTRLKGSITIQNKPAPLQSWFSFIINGRSGRCTEDCKFCAQSAHHCTGIEEYAFLDKHQIVTECNHNEKQGVHRFAIVTAGRRLNGDEFEKALDTYRTLSCENHVGL